jgi:hypothetical protein
MMLLCGCGQSEERSAQNVPPQAKTGAPAVSPVLVTMTPADLTSATANTPVTLWLDNGDRPVPPAIVESVRASIELEEYPSGKRVAIATQVQPGVSPQGPLDSTLPKGAPPTPRQPVIQNSNPQRTAVVVVSKVPLAADQWFRASFDATNVRTMATMNPVGRDGRSGSRFIPGHAAVVQSVEVCDKGALTSKVVVRFSEPVQRDGGLGLAISDAAKGTPCKDTSTDPTALQQAFGFSCSASATLHLALGTAIKSVDGLPAGLVNPSAGVGVVEQPPVDTAVDLGASFKSESQCKMWVP